MELVKLNVLEHNAAVIGRDYLLKFLKQKPHTKKYSFYVEHLKQELRQYPGWTTYLAKMPGVSVSIASPIILGMHYTNMYNRLWRVRCDRKEWLSHANSISCSKVMRRFKKALCCSKNLCYRKLYPYYNVDMLAQKVLSDYWDLIIKK